MQRSKTSSSLTIASGQMAQDSSFALMQLSHLTESNTAATLRFKSMEVEQ